MILAQNLIESGIPLTDAAYSCGFTDYTVFYRAYKKYYGVSPKETVNRGFLSGLPLL